MSTFEAEAVALRLAKERAAAAEHRLRHAQASLTALQDLASRNAAAELRRLEGAGASAEERLAAEADQVLLGAEIAKARALMVVCACAEHPGADEVPAAEIERAFVERKPRPVLYVVRDCGRTSADEHLAATDDGWPDRHGEGPGGAA